MNLTGPSSSALARVVASTGESKTQAINRALRLLDWVQGQLDAGGSVYVKEAGADQPERLKLL